ncbi:MAG: hypothetical protein ACOY9Y_03240 [Bacillota bacterium]
MKLTVAQFVIQTIPESLALVAFALAVCGQRLVKKHVLAAGLLFAVTVYVLRALPIAFGVHTMAALLAGMVWLRAVTGISHFKALYGLLVGILLLATIEMVCLNALVYVTGKLLEAIRETWLWPFSGLPHVVILGGIAIGIDRFIKQRHLSS